MREPLRVLVAEADEAMRDLFEALLHVRGHDVTTASDGPTAIAAFRRERPALAVIDWEMPLVDGLELCGHVRALEDTRTTFVLAVTSRGREEELAGLLDAGADDYVAKPVTAEHLIARLAIAEKRIALEAQRRNAEAALARAQWLAGIGQTTLALQHEINNPLAALLGHASLLSSSSTSAEHQRQHIEVILEQARRIAAVVQRLARLKDPKSVEYLAGMRMIDISEE